MPQYIRPYNNEIHRGTYNDYDKKPNFLLTIELESEKSDTTAQSISAVKKPISQPAVAYCLGIICSSRPKRTNQCFGRSKQDKLRSNPYCFIQYFLIDKKYQKDNMGTNFMCIILTKISDMFPGKEVDCEVQATKTAIKFWSRLGFHEVRQHYSNEEITIMGLKLSPEPSMDPENVEKAFAKLGLKVLYIPDDDD